MRVLPSLTAAGLVAASLLSARAEEWCGFVDKAGSQVRCGFSSLAECKQTNRRQKKDAYCMPDPAFANHGMRFRLAATTSPRGAMRLSILGRHWLPRSGAISVGLTHTGQMKFFSSMRLITAGLCRCWFSASSRTSKAAGRAHACGRPAPCAPLPRR